MVLKSKKVFDLFSQMAKERGGFAAIVAKVNGMYQFTIYKNLHGPRKTWTVDLKNAPGRTSNLNPLNIPKEPSTRARSSSQTWSSR